MAHGSPTIRCCKKCKTYGMMPRFGSYTCDKCGGNTEEIIRSEAKVNQYVWIGWYK